jgi:hypothetical protein
MKIEQTFAAEVANARGNARLANTSGFPQRICDQVAGALAELWAAGREAGISARDIDAIAKRYVEFDANDEAWPRSLPENVVPFRR